jgi:hypothetical protein
MTQMNTGLELYFNTYKSYPTATVGVGVPESMDEFTKRLPIAPGPADGFCDILTHSSPVPPGVPANTYYYYPSGTLYTINGREGYPEYSYYFCLGGQTGNYGPGERIMMNKGVK